MHKRLAMIYYKSIETQIDTNLFALITAYMHLDMLKRTEGNTNIFLVLISLISACICVHPK